MLTMQQPTTINHSPLGTNIRSAMAANLGSSLFLFQGFHRISPHLLNAAASSSSSPSSRSASPSPSYFRFELQCTRCRRGECPICLDYNSKVRIGYSLTQTSSTRGSAGGMTKKQARDSSEGIQILRLDLCSYNRKVDLTRSLLGKWVGASYSEGDAAGSKPKEVDFDGLMRELRAAEVDFGLVDKAQMEQEEEEQYAYRGSYQDSSAWESRTQRLSGSYQRGSHGYGHGRCDSGSSSGYYRL